MIGGDVFVFGVWFVGECGVVWYVGVCGVVYCFVCVW